MTEPRSVTQLLAAARDGDRGALDELLPMVYAELRGLAFAQMRGVPTEDSLQPTALVHEAYLRLLGKDNQSWNDRGHFFAVAARAMRDIVVERARHHAAAKRGGNRQRVSLDADAIPTEEQAEDLIALDDALDRLARIDDVGARIVTLRFYGGLTREQIAAVLEISESTVHREWAYARAWLYNQLEDGGSVDG